MIERMRRHLKNYLIPHEGNEHKPHIVREASVLALTLVTVLIFGFSVFQATLVRTSTEFLAAVIPAVLVDLANEDRTDADLGTLTINPVLEEAARMKAEHMAQNEYFAHVSPDGVDPWYWFYRAGYSFASAGENLAINFSDSKDVSRAWMDSPGHRANILNGKFTEIGIAAVEGMYKGRKTIYVVQLFGTPLAKAFSDDTITVAAVPVPAEAQEQVAGENVVVEDVTEAPAPVAEPVVEETDLSAEVVGGEAAPRTANTNVQAATFFEEVLSQPRAVVEWGYLVIGLLIAFALLLMVLARVHKIHSRNMLYGVILLVLLALLFYFNYLLLSKDLLIV